MLDEKGIVRRSTEIAPFGHRLRRDDSFDLVFWLSALTSTGYLVNLNA